MDDHFYRQMLDYACCYLIPRFKKEYEKHGTFTKCYSYEEVQEFCKALNVVGDWLGYDKVTPSDLIRRY